MPNIDYSVLLNALNDSKRLTRINLINSDISRNTIRSYNLSSYALEKTPIGLMDHSQVATLTEGFIMNGSEKTRRYVGLSKSKISDYSNDYLSIDEYYNWLIELNNKLKTKSFKSNYLRRFAQIVKSPANTQAAHILIDIDDDTLNDFKFDGKYKIQIEELSKEISRNSFELKVFYNKRETTYKCEIHFDPKSSKYKILCPELAKQIYDPYSRQSLLSFLNKYQPLRVVTKNNQYFYSLGNFYSPKLDLLKRGDDLDILNIFEAVPELENIKSEKGNNTILCPTSKAWHKDTLFGLVVRKGNKITGLQEYFGFDYLVCDDLDDENADFIGINNKRGEKRIVLIHAKAGHSRLSASHFQEVCGQTVKNLDLLSPFYEKAPLNKFKKWDGHWKESRVGTINSRIIHGKKNGKELWDLYQKLLSDPDTIKEVYILTGSLFCKSDLTTELQSKKNIEDVKPEVIQLVYLIRTTWSAVTSVGASLKIFCY